MLILIAVALSVVGWQYGTIAGCVGLYVALAFVLVGGAYGGLFQDLYGKRPDGTRPAWSHLLLLPYSVLAAISFRVSLFLTREPAFARLEQKIYFGRRLLGVEADQGLAEGWIGVLDLAGEFDENPRLRRCPFYQSLPVLDTAAPSFAEIQFAVRWLQDTTARGPIYVHCALGHGRTGTVLIAYLLVTRQIKDWSEGLTCLRALRSGVGLNRIQVRRLEEYTAILGAALSRE